MHSCVGHECASSATAEVQPWLHAPTIRPPQRSHAVPCATRRRTQPRSQQRELTKRPAAQAWAPAQANQPHTHLALGAPLVAIPAVECRRPRFVLLLASFTCSIPIHSHVKVATATSLASERLTYRCLGIIHERSLHPWLQYGGSEGRYGRNRRCPKYEQTAFVQHPARFPRARHGANETAGDVRALQREVRTTLATHIHATPLRTIALRQQRFFRCGQAALPSGCH